MLRVYDEQGENVNKNPAGTMIPDRVVCLELARPTISVDLTERDETLFFKRFEGLLKFVARDCRPLFLFCFSDDSVSSVRGESRSQYGCHIWTSLPLL